ncbi:MAG: hypothetical protein IJU75_00450 [Clostridia bacterium]|nr:hypothetical protein [Clostridia bacterium]
MKKIFVFLLMSIVVLTSSCLYHHDNVPSARDVTDSRSTESVSDKTEEDATANSETVTSANINEKGDFTSHISYSEFRPFKIGLSDLEKYDADDEVKTVESAYGTIKIYPVLGSYFQPTPYSAYVLFDADGELTGIQIEKRDFDTDSITPETVNDQNQRVKDGDISYIRVKFPEDNFSPYEWYSFEGYRTLLEKYPDYELLAFLKTPYCVGKVSPDAHIQTFIPENTEPQDIKLPTGIFYSLSDAREAFKNNFASEIELRDEIVVFPWKNHDWVFYSKQYIASSALYRDYFFNGTETVLTIPLLTSSGEEGTDFVCVFYENGSVIAETVYKIVEPYKVINKAGNEVEKTLKIVFERTGNHTDDGYETLDHIEYVSFINSLGDLSGISGVYADENGYHAVKR